MASSFSLSIFPTQQITMTAKVIITLFCVLLVPILLYISRTVRERRRHGFALMKLPAEIRLNILRQMIDEEQSIIKPRKPSKRKNESVSSFVTLRSYLSSPTPNLYTTLTRVNHQLREEFLEVFCQRAPFTFTLDASSAESKDPFWNVSSRLRSSMRSVRIKILATPGLGNGFDPRVVTGNWHLKDRVFEALNDMTKLQDLRLSIQACGNQLWNPIWLWHYTSQSFKESEVKAFKRMSFDLEGWNMREPNHLQRNEAGMWEWRCSLDHLLLSDSEGQQPVRQFCGALYAECRVCDAEKEDE